MLPSAMTRVCVLLCVYPDAVVDSLVNLNQVVLADHFTAVGVQGDARVYAYIAM